MSGAQTAYTVNAQDLVKVILQNGQPVVSGSCYRLNVILNQLSARISSIEQAEDGETGVSGSTSITIEVTDITLKAASTAVSAPATGDLWAVILRQDATGGRAITWGSGIQGASVSIDTTANTISAFFFVKSGMVWVSIAQFITGNTTGNANLQPVMSGQGKVTFPGTNPSTVSNVSGAIVLTPGGTAPLVAINATASPQTTAGRGFMLVTGTSDRGVYQLVTQAADGNGVGVGNIEWVDRNSVAADKRIIQVTGLLNGTTANNRGGEIIIALKPDAGTIGNVLFLFASGGLLLASSGSDPGTNSIGIAGTVTLYKNASTAGLGVPGIYASVSITNQGSAVGSTALQVGGAVAPAGSYRVSTYAATHTAGTGNSTITLGWNDGNGAKTTTPAILSFTANNFGISTAFIRADGVNNITYSASYAATGTFDLYITLERLS